MRSLLNRLGIVVEETVGMIGEIARKLVIGAAVLVLVALFYIVGCLVAGVPVRLSPWWLR